MKTTEPWERFAAILSGEATPAEQEAFAAWLAADPAHRQQFEALRAIWEAKVPAPAARMAPDAALARLHERLEAEATPPPARQMQLSWAWGWAAAILLLLGLVYFWEPGRPAASFLTYQTGAGQKLPVQLPDGSRVLLNAHSRLQWVPAGDHLRELRLEGEAFFDVAPAADRPFLVRAGQARVRVLGTAFNLRAYPQDSTVTAAVQAGKVSLGLQGHKDSLTLAADEVGSWHRAAPALQKQPKPLRQALAWTQDELHFRQQPLPVILAKMQQWYGVPIVTEGGALDGCRLTADFTHLSLDEVLELIGRVHPLEARQQGDTLFIQGTPCPAAEGL